MTGGIARPLGSWRDVRPLIDATAERIPDTRLVVFPPAGAPPADAMPVGTERVAVTRARAALLVTTDRYLAQANTLESRTGVSELEIQKLAYFLQLLGVRVGLRFARGSRRSCGCWTASRPRTAWSCWRPCTSPRAGPVARPTTGR